MILAITSVLFGVSAYYAAIVGDHLNFVLLLIQTHVSIIHHANGADETKYMAGSIIGPLDVTIAHCLAANGLYNTLYMSPSQGMPIWLSVAYLFVCYNKKIKTRPVKTYLPYEINPWHVSQHIVANAALMWSIYTKSHNLRG